MLSSDINPSDPSLMDLTGDDDIPSSAQIDEYGYESDSDLDDCDDTVPAINHEVPKGYPATPPSSPPKVKASAETRHGDDDK